MLNLFAVILMVLPRSTATELPELQAYHTGEHGWTAEITGTLHSFPFTDFAHQNMATDGKPASSQLAYLVLPPLLKPDNSNSHTRLFFAVSGKTNHFPLSSTHHSIVLASTSLISSYLAHRFTLVGSKPSGTS